MRYSYYCGACSETFTVPQAMNGTIAKAWNCPYCGNPSPRDFKADLPPPPHYNAQGFHKTDYDDRGDKLETLNRTWSRITGEKPPPPDSTVPRNSSEPT